MLLIKKGKIAKSVGIKLLGGKVTKPQQEGESYKCLGISEADRFLREEMNLKVFTKYFTQLKKF